MFAIFPSSNKIEKYLFLWVKHSGMLYTMHAAKGRKIKLTPGGRKYVLDFKTYKWTYKLAFLRLYTQASDFWFRFVTHYTTIHVKYDIKSDLYYEMEDCGLLISTFSLFSSEFL